jgi:hypothetical protein
MSMVSMETKTQSLINLQFKHSKNCFLALISQIIFKIKSANFPIVNYFRSNHLHNLRLKVYLVVNLVIIYVKKIISVKTF